MSLVVVVAVVWVSDAVVAVVVVVVSIVVVVAFVVVVNCLDRCRCLCRRHLCYRRRPRRRYVVVLFLHFVIRRVFLFYSGDGVATPGYVE